MHHLNLTLATILPRLIRLNQKNIFLHLASNSKSLIKQNKKEVSGDRLRRTRPTSSSAGPSPVTVFVASKVSDCGKAGTAPLFGLQTPWYPTYVRQDVNNHAVGPSRSRHKGGISFSKFRPIIEFYHRWCYDFESVPMRRDSY